MLRRPIFGIDLGTTYSCIAHVDDSGKPVIIPNTEGDQTTPSVVYFEGPETIVAGKPAKNAAKIDPGRVQAFIKRHMADPTFSFEADGRKYRPEEIASFILRKLVQDAAIHTQIEVTDVVITCPAYFGINEREATKNAGRLAGLTVHHILNEPTAAAIAYGLNQPGDRVVLVYDFGGGTFDITLIEIRGGDIRVVYTDGDHNLGGKDADDRIVSYLAEEYMRQKPNAGDPRSDAHTAQQLQTDAEEAKKGLSVREKWPCVVSYKGERVRVELTRDRLEELVADLVSRTVDLTLRVVDEGRKRGCGKIEQLVLVGGSSRMPCVPRSLKQALGLEPVMFEPDLAVAKGAALMGLRILAGEIMRDEIAVMQGVPPDEVDVKNQDARTLQGAAENAAARGKAAGIRTQDLIRMVKESVVNVCSKGFGIVVVSDDKERAEEVAYIIHGNTPVPVERLETTFGTVRPNQRGVHIQVMEQAGQCESRDMENNRQIAEGNIVGLPPGLPKGSAVHVKFGLEEDGTLKVTAVEPTSGRDLRLEIKVEGIMSNEEVQESKERLIRMQVA